MKYQATITRIALHRKGVNPVYGEGVTYLELADEAAGPFYRVSQITDQNESEVRLDLDELAALHALARSMLQQVEYAHD